jgi:hypothetical protein
MMWSRPKLILAGMVAVAVILALVLFVHPAGEKPSLSANPAPHAPDQTPR